MQSDTVSEKGKGLGQRSICLVHFKCVHIAYIYATQETTLSKTDRLELSDSHKLSPYDVFGAQSLVDTRFYVGIPGHITCFWL